MIRLNAIVLSQDIEAAIRPNPRGMKRIILKTEYLTINGKKAVRQYEESEGDFPNTLITSVQIDQYQSATIVIYYTKTNPYAEKFIDQINSSVSVQ